jgi:hypothetical protein
MAASPSPLHNADAVVTGDRRCRADDDPLDPLLGKIADAR